MANNFLVLVALAAAGWLVVDGSPQKPVTPSSARLARTGPSVPPTTIVDRSTAPEARRDPVPLVRQDPAPLAPDVQPLSSRSSSANMSAAKAEAQPQAPNGLDRNTARAAVEADGYRRVSILGKASNGAWRAKGYRGTTEVQLIVDDTGRVSME